MEDLIFRGYIDETEVGRLVSGMPMKITIGALQDLSLEASLEYISPKAVQNNGANQFEIKAALRLASLVHKPSGQAAVMTYSNEQATKIRAGFSANAEIVLEEASKVLCVPESAIEFSGDSTFVYVVRSKEKGSKEKGSNDSEGKYQRTAVVTGLSDGVDIEIKQGLTLQDRVRGPQIITDDDDNGN